MGDATFNSYVVGPALSATPTELDDFARAVATLCASSEPAHWVLDHRKLGEISYDGLLVDRPDLDLANVRQLSIRVRGLAGSREVVIATSWAGYRGDVWAESAAEAKDIAAVVRGRLKDFHPWWSFWRTYMGRFLLSCGAGAVFVLLFVAWGALTHSVVSQTDAIIVVATSAIGGQLASVLFAPSLRIGERVSRRDVVQAVVGWTALAILSGIIGAIVAVPVTAAFTQ